MQCLGCLPVQRTSSAAESLGMTDWQVRRLLNDGVLVRLRRNVVVGACLVERASADRKAAHELALKALLVAYPDAAASHESAALASQLPVFAVPPVPIATRAAGAWRGGLSGRIRIAPLPPEHLTTASGVSCTTVPRTVVDVARTATLMQAVVVGDAALRERRCTPTDLADMVSQLESWADVGKAREAVNFLDARAESPLESISRVAMHEHCLPPPEPQVWRRGASGKWYRVDFYWEQFRLIGEADGKVKYGFAEPDQAADEAVWQEKLREDDLRDADEQVVRWTYGQMVSQTTATIDRLRRRMT